MAKNVISWYQIGFLDPKNIIVGAIECPNFTLGNISHAMSHRNWFTTSSAYKLCLKSPILVQKAQNIEIFCAKLDFHIPKIRFYILKMPSIHLSETLSMA